MNAKLDKYLVKKYPYLFWDRHADLRNTAMCWGFACGDGWYKIIKEAAEQLEPLIKEDARKNSLREKGWYKYIRNAIGFTATSTAVFKVLYGLANKIWPNMYNNPVYWYGGSPRASQIKEKYGTLRFSLTHGTEAMYAITDKAERQSSKICEQCGKPGKLRGRSWLYTACSKHIRELE